MRSLCETAEEEVFIGQRQGRGPRAKQPPKLSHRVVETLRELGDREKLGTAGCPGVWGRAWGLSRKHGLVSGKPLEAVGGR